MKDKFKMIKKTKSGKLDMRKHTWKHYYEALQASGNVKQALRSEPKFRDWYYNKRKRK